jgi:hypothetical protein
VQATAALKYTTSQVRPNGINVGGPLFEKREIAGVQGWI